MATARTLTDDEFDTSADDLNGLGGDGDGDQTPYPELAELRERGEVLEGWPHLGLESSPDRPLHAAYGFGAVRKIMSDGRTFSSRIYADVIGPMYGRTILEMDPPEHTTSREIHRHAFARSSIAAWDEALVQPLVRSTVEGFVEAAGPDRKVDLVRNLFTSVPVRIIGAVLGLPADDIAWFHRRGVELISFRADLDRAKHASAQLAEYYREIIAERRKNPQDDMISILLAAESDVGGSRMTEEEIVSFLRNLLPAGGETTARSSASLMLGLLTHPEQLDAVRADRSLIPQAIEEGIRWETPLLNFIREATQDAEVAGVTIPAGSTVMVSLGGANRDTSRWDEPDRFDIFRDRKAHAGFGHGPHLCLGMHLARLETTIMLNTVLDLMPEVRLDPDAPAPYVSGRIFRSPPRLDVTWG